MDEPPPRQTMHTPQTLNETHSRVATTKAQEPFDALLARILS